MRKNSDNNPTLLGTLYQLYVNKLGLLLLVLVIISGLLFFFGARDKDSIQGVIFIAVGGSLLASAVFSVLYIFITNINNYDLIQGLIQDENKSARLAVTSDIRSLFPEYMPTAIYSATKSMKSEFNFDITDSCESSHSYTFKGFSGKFVPIRIKNSKNSFTNVRLILANPSDTSSFYVTVRHMMSSQNQKSNGDYEKVQKDIVSDIFTCIIGLYQYCRFYCSSCKIVFWNDPIIDRYELFDDCVYITPFQKKNNRGFYFPQSTRYSLDSYIYDSSKRKAEAIFETNRDNVITMCGYGYTEDNLYADLKKLGANNVDEELIATHIEKIAELEQKLIGIGDTHQK